MKRLGILFVLLLGLTLVSCTAGNIYIPPTLTPLAGSEPQSQKVAVIETARGTIYCVLRPDAAPQTVANFEKLVKDGFYNGKVFFRVEPGFVIQGGSPTNDATGDIGYTVPAEINLPHTAGALAAARVGDQYNPTRASSGSQFYITLAATSQLDGAYTVFGDCGGSLDVVKKIQKGDAMTRVRVEDR